MLRGSITVICAAVVAAAIAGCSTGAPAADPPPSTPTAAQPTPEPTESPSTDSSRLNPDQAWLVQAEINYLTASTRVCFDEDVLLESAESGAITLEGNGGLPDDWVPGEPYMGDVNTISLNLRGGLYDAERFDGDVLSGIGTGWMTTGGPLIVERDANGVVTGGSGSGVTRIAYEDGSSERQDAVMTFSVSVVAAPPWCSLAD